MKIVVHSILGILLAIGLAHSACGQGNPPAGAAVMQRLPQLKVFFEAKASQALADNGGKRAGVAPEVWELFSAAQAGRWDAVTNGSAALSARLATNETGLAAATTLSAAWQPVAEVVIVVNAFLGGDGTFAQAYGEDIVKSIPPGAIYFGGTDWGRGLVSAFSKSHAAGQPFFTLTQNQLVSDSYRQYAHRMYGGKINLPDNADMKRVTDDYKEAALRRMRANELLPQEEVRNENGNFIFSGRDSTMAINGRLAQVICERNPTREIYVQESHPIEWMYPRLAPAGLVMRLHRAALPELTPEQVARDHAFWSEYCGRLVGPEMARETTVSNLCEFIARVYVRRDYAGFQGDVKYLADGNAQGAFARLRSAIGGVYAYRAAQATGAERDRMYREAQFALQQSVALDPSNAEVVLRLINLLLAGGGEPEQFGDALQIAQTCAQFDSLKGPMTALAPKLRELKTQADRKAAATARLPELQAAWQSDRAGSSNAFALARSYMELGDTNHAAETLLAVLDTTNGESRVVIAIARFFMEANRMPDMEKALARLVQINPGDADAWYDLAGVRALLKRTDTMDTLKKALALSAERRQANTNASNLAEFVVKDNRFRNLREDPEFKQLTGSK